MIKLSPVLKSEKRKICMFIVLSCWQLPELEVKDLADNSRAFQLLHQDGDVRPYPLLIAAHNDSAKDAWLKEIRQYAADSRKSLSGNFKLDRLKKSGTFFY